MFGKKEKEYPKKIRLVSQDRDGTIREYKARLNSDNEIEGRGRARGRSYVFSRDAVRRVPTLAGKLHLSSNTRPALIVTEEDPEPIDLRRDGEIAVSAYDLNKFKRMTLAKQLVHAAQKDSPMDALKMLVVIALAGMVLLALLVLYVISLLGGFADQPAGAGQAASAALGLVPARGLASRGGARAPEA